MPPAGFDPAVPTSERQQAYALEGAAIVHINFQHKMSCKFGFFGAVVMWIITGLGFAVCYRINFLSCSH